MRIVVITGGGSGLGRALALEYKKRGDTVVIAGNNEEQLNDVAREAGLVAIRTDVTEEAEVHALKERVVHDYGRIDVWVNNAGIWTPHGPIETMNTVRMKALFSVNTFGLIYGSREALIQMRLQGEGTILNVISVSALSPRPQSAAYSATKWATRGFTEALRAECAGSGIRVAAVYPGRMDTALFQGTVSDAERATYLKPEAVARTVVDALNDSEAKLDMVIQ